MRTGLGGNLLSINDVRPSIAQTPDSLDFINSYSFSIIPIRGM